MGLWSNDVGMWLLALIQQIVRVEQTTFITIFERTVSLWDIDLLFGVGIDLIVLFVPTFQDYDSDGGIYKKHKL